MKGRRLAEFRWHAGRRALWSRGGQHRQHPQALKQPGEAMVTSATTGCRGAGVASADIRHRYRGNASRRYRKFEAPPVAAAPRPRRWRLEASSSAFWRPASACSQREASPNGSSPVARKIRDRVAASQPVSRRRPAGDGNAGSRSLLRHWAAMVGGDWVLNRVSTQPGYP